MEVVVDQAVGSRPFLKEFVEQNKLAEKAEKEEKNGKFLYLF